MIRVAPRVNRSIEHVGMRHTDAGAIVDDDAMHPMTGSVHNRKRYFASAI
jgi:hypothetical protein